MVTWFLSQNDEESGLITGLIADLRAKAPADLVILDVIDWIAELERQNNVFIALEATRNSEEANRSELRMKQVRVEVDEAVSKGRQPLFFCFILQKKWYQIICIFALYFISLCL